MNPCPRHQCPSLPQQSVPQRNQGARGIAMHNGKGHLPATTDGCPFLFSGERGVTAAQRPSDPLVRVQLPSLTPTFQTRPAALTASRAISGAERPAPRDPKPIVGPLPPQVKGEANDMPQL